MSKFEFPPTPANGWPKVLYRRRRGDSAGGVGAAVRCGLALLLSVGGGSVCWAQAAASSNSGGESASSTTSEAPANPPAKRKAAAPKKKPSKPATNGEAAASGSNSTSEKPKTAPKKKPSAKPRAGSETAEGNSASGSEKPPRKPATKKPAKPTANPPAATSDAPSEGDAPPDDAPPGDDAQPAENTAEGEAMPEEVAEDEAAPAMAMPWLEPPDPQLEEGVPEALQFQQRQQAWRDAGNELRRVMALPPDPADPQSRQTLIDVVLERNSMAANRLTNLSEYLFRKNDRNIQAREFLVFVSRSLFDGDRLEDAVRIGKLLREHGFDAPKFASMIGRAAYDISDLATAREFLKHAESRGELDEVGREMLAHIDEEQTLLNAELRRQADESSRNALPRVVLRTTQGEIVLELFQNDAPNTISNFVTLVQTGFYDGLAVHRVVSGFGATMGCPRGDGTGGPGYEIFPELSRDKRPHFRGSVSMIAAPGGVSGSQLFIAYRASTARPLDGTQPVFGRVVEGLDVLVRLRRVEPRRMVPGLGPDRIVEARIVRDQEQNRQVTTTIDPVNRRAIQGLELAERGKLDEARRILEEVVRDYPNHFEATLGLAVLAVSQEDLPTCEKYLLRCLEIRPNHPDVNFKLGLLYAMQNRLDESVERFRGVIRLRPKDWQSYNNLAAILSQQQKFDEAIEVMLAVEKIDPNIPQLKENLATLRAQKVEFDKQQAAQGSAIPSGDGAAAPPAESPPAEDASAGS